jgi:hypothetical protein
VEVIYHPLVKRDMAEALKYYDSIATKLADEFEAELKALIENTAKNPLRHHLAGPGFRRANCARFPYHMLYEIHACGLRIMLIRHNKRHPNYGLKRK